MNRKSFESGFASLMLLVIVMSVALASALSLGDIGVVGAQDERLRTSRLQAYQSAFACSERGLLALRDSGSFAGTLFDSPIDCTYTVTSQGGNAYIVSSTGVHNDSSKTIHVSAEFNGTQVTVNGFSFE